MTDHIEEHEDLLRAVVVGELDSSDPSVAARRQACAECDRALASMLGAQSALEADREEQQALLELARGIEDAPEEVVEAFRHHPEVVGVAGAAPDLRPAVTWSARQSVGAAVLALAAALLAFFMVPDFGPGGGGGFADPDHRTLGAGDTSDIVLVQPLGAVRAYGNFAWSIASDLEPEVGYYVLVVRQNGQAQEVAKLRSTTWEDPSLTVGFADTIEWWVEAFGVGGDELAISEPARARRSH